MPSPKNLSDDALLKNLTRLNSNGVGIEADVLLNLLEVGRRRLHIARGYSSLFTYCVEVLKNCDGTAGRRVNAVKCIEKFPEILTLFAQQKINLTTISLISKILTSENRKTVLNAVCGKRKGEVERYVAGYLPGKNIREVVKPLPSRAVTDDTAVKTMPSVPNVTQTKERSEALKANSNMVEYNSSGGVGNYSKSHEKESERSVNFEIKLKASEAAVKKLKRVQELRGKKESMGKLLEVLLDDYLEKNSPEARIFRREEREARLVKGSEDSKKAQNFENSGAFRSRYIPQKVRDKIFQRFGGQCCYVAEDGRRCTSKSFLHVDHIQPYGMGGTHDEENLRLLCSAHNGYMAEMVYGPERMRRRRIST